MKFKLRVLLLSLAALSLACGITSAAPTSTGISLYPPDTFQESDLIGTWDNWRHPGKEILTLMPDQTFKQIYDTVSQSEPSGRYHFESQGQWWLEYRPSGCVYVHLEGMRYFYLTRSIAESGNRHPSGSLQGEPWPFWDPCEERVITMPDKVILIIGSVPDFQRGIQLVHLTAESGQLNEVLQLVNTSTPD